MTRFRNDRYENDRDDDRPQRGDDRYQDNRYRENRSQDDGRPDRFRDAERRFDGPGSSAGRDRWERSARFFSDGSSQSESGYAGGQSDWGPQDRMGVGSDAYSDTQDFRDSGMLGGRRRGGRPDAGRLEDRYDRMGRSVSGGRDSGGYDREFGGADYGRGAMDQGYLGQGRMSSGEGYGRYSEDDHNDRPRISQDQGGWAYGQLSGPDQDRFGQSYRAGPGMGEQGHRGMGHAGKGPKATAAATTASGKRSARPCRTTTRWTPARWKCRWKAAK